MISAILFTATILALVSLTAWIVNRTFKENRKLIEMAREADCERTEAIELKEALAKAEQRLSCTYLLLPDKWEVSVALGQATVYAVHRKGSFEERTSVKCYRYDIYDSESEDFARRNAEELVEILKREVV